MTTIVTQITQDGEMNLPLQPGGNAYLSSSTSNNATGDGTTYTVVFDTKNFDQGSNYNNSTGTLTIPRTGNYLLIASVVLNNVGGGHTLGSIEFIINGSVLIGTSTYYNVSNVKDPANNCSLSGSIIYRLNAMDTVVVTVTVSGSSKTVGVFGSGSAHYTYFSFALLS